MSGRRRVRAVLHDDRMKIERALAVLQAARDKAAADGLTWSKYKRARMIAKIRELQFAPRPRIKREISMLEFVEGAR